jgi:hypothetical protein
MFGLSEVSYMALEEKQRPAAIRRTFRYVFGTREGREVLAVILADLHFFEEATNPDAQALRNYSMTFLRERLGIKDPQAMTCAILNTARGD